MKPHDLPRVQYQVDCVPDFDSQVRHKMRSWHCITYSSAQGRMSRCGLLEQLVHICHLCARSYQSIWHIYPRTTGQTPLGFHGLSTIAERQRISKTVCFTCIGL